MQPLTMHVLTPGQDLYFSALASDCVLGPELGSADWMGALSGKGLKPSTSLWT